MTHTHHRRGSRESLKGDYVVLYMLDPEVKAQRAYKAPLKERVKRLNEICLRYEPVAISAKYDEKRLRYLKGWEKRMDSGVHLSSTLEEIGRADELLDEGLGHSVYTNREALKGVLKDLKAADLGISVVVSGVFDEVFDVCREVGIVPHTVNMSLGTWGKKELLPESPLLEICTMCGHAMISVKLVESLIERVEKGAMTAEDAAVEMGKQCTCNVFNTVRAAELVRQHLNRKS